jgi:hypothetical protein
MVPNQNSCDGSNDARMLRAHLSDMREGELRRLEGRTIGARDDLGGRSVVCQEFSCR